MSEAHIAFSKAGRTTARGVLFSTNSRPLTLLGTAIDVESHWTHARVKVRQEYRSDHPISVSAFAAFNSNTSDSNWQLLSFRCEVGQHAAFTKVVPKPAGEASYASQRTEKADDMFTANIPFTIHAGQSVLCTIIYLCPLKFTDGGSDKVTFTLPKGLITGAMEVEGSEWKQSFTVPHETRLGAGRTLFNADGYLFSNAAAAPMLTNAGSFPGAQCNKKADPRRFTVQLEDRSPSLVLPADITFQVPLVVEEDPVSVQVTRDNGEHIADEDRYALAVALDPQFPAGSRPNVEVVVMLDDSLSMSAHTDSVKESLKALVSGLPSSCFLNIVKFGSSKCSWMYPEGALPVSTESVQDFKAYVDKWDPTDSSTKIFQAVREVYSQATIEGFARVVVLITDGSEGKHSGHILEVVDANKHTTRVVAVGLGETVDRTLLSRMAEVSGGFYGAVGGTSSPSDLCGVLCDCVGQTMVPTICHMDLSFIYDGNDEVPPTRKCFTTLALVPMGTKAVIYGLGGDDLRGCTCLVTGSAGPNHLEYKVHTGEIMATSDKTTSTVGDAATASIAHQAAAANRIRALVDYNPNSILKSSESAEVQRLGVSFCLSTPLTTLQGHDGSGSPAIDPKCRMTTYKYSYLRQLLVMDAPPATLDCNGAAVDPDSKTARATATANAAKLNAGSSIAATTTTTAAKTVALDVLESIVSNICSSVSAPAVLQAQSVEGAFTASSPAVISLLAKSGADILAAKPNEVAEATWVTAMVNTKMEKVLTSEQTRLASKKALLYLAAQQDHSLAAEALTSVEI